MQAFLPERCAAVLGAANNASAVCGVPHIAYQYLQTPVFVMESLTDVIILCGFEGMPCTNVEKTLLDPQVWSEVNSYGHNASKMLTATVMQSQRDGLFAPNCLLHTGFTLDGPLIQGVNAVQAMWNWLSATRSSNPMATPIHLIDSCKDNLFFPPCGKQCPKTP